MRWWFKREAKVQWILVLAPVVVAMLMALVGVCLLGQTGSAQHSEVSGPANP